MRQDPDRPALAGRNIDPDTFQRVWDRVMPGQAAPRQSSTPSQQGGGPLEAPIYRLEGVVKAKEETMEDFVGPLAVPWSNSPGQPDAGRPVQGLPL
mgnify:CR=1 FL=1